MVKDQDVAKLLMPFDHPYATKHLIDADYYDTYNRDNVGLVDINQHHCWKSQTKGEN